jgi:hypothetical protein
MPPPGPRQLIRKERHPHHAVIGAKYLEIINEFGNIRRSVDH